MHLNAFQAFQSYARPYFKAGMTCLEISPLGWPGCHQIDLAQQGIRCEWKFAQLGEENDHPDFVRFNSEYAINAPMNFFDIVFHSQVLEHVRKPWRWFPELARITKPGGHIISISPVDWPFHEGEGWKDVARYWPEGVKALGEDAGLECVLGWAGSTPNCADIDTCVVLRKPLKG